MMPWWGVILVAILSGSFGFLLCAVMAAAGVADERADAARRRRKEGDAGPPVHDLDSAYKQGRKDERDMLFDVMEGRN